MHWLARLVLLAYVFQVAAVDHWHVDPADVTGVEGTSRHVAHCHGDTAGCSDAASALVGTLSGESLTPLPPRSLFGEVPRESASYVEAVLLAPDQPPRAA